MKRLWTAREHSLELSAMPFFWRVADDGQAHPDIATRMPIRVERSEDLDYLEYKPTAEEAASLACAYSQNANIGFLNPESGQITTYGASVNQFFKNVLTAHQPRRVYEIGCGAGFSISYLAQYGWTVTGIDPSEYSYLWSQRLGFDLINSYFTGAEIPGDADLIYCNDVFEHIPNVESFARQVAAALAPGGVFCFATTNSTRSIAMGDVSMLEHQHVNMFTERALRLILMRAGFGQIEVRGGSYGNTFHVTAVKGGPADTELPPTVSGGFFVRAARTLEAFAAFYEATGANCRYYVPLRCIPYLAAVGEYGNCTLYDSNTAWRGKFLDGYDRPIAGLDDLPADAGGRFFIGSLTFFEEIKASLTARGFASDQILSIQQLCSDPQP